MQSPDSVRHLPVHALKKLVLASGRECFDILDKETLVERALEAVSIDSATGGDCPYAATDAELRCDDLSSAQRSSVVRLPGFLSGEEIDAIHALAASMGSSSFTADRYDGAWATRFLNAGGAFRAALPALLSRLVDAARDVDAAQGWHLLPPEDGGSASPPRVAPRVVEYHTVQRHGSLPWAHHYDAGSLLTIDCMLSHDHDFAGGAFQTLEADGELRPHPFARGDVQVFRSHKKHCVAPVTEGTRTVLVLELWEGPERKCAHRCELRGGVCPLERRQ